jgi:hypothetical protein
MVKKSPSNLKNLSKWRIFAHSRVARWFLFKPKIPIWVNLGGKMFIYFMAIWNILQTFGIFCNHFEHFLVFGTLFSVLVSCTKKHLATLHLKHDGAVGKKVAKWVLTQGNQNSISKHQSDYINMFHEENKNSFWK